LPVPEGFATLYVFGTTCETVLVCDDDLRFDVNCSILFTELPLLARPAAAKAGARVLVEAINSVDVPAFPIDSSAAAIAVIDKSPRPTWPSSPTCTTSP
jgi:hydroxypyruvate isomerase